MSAPVQWDELRAALDSGKSDSIYFSPDALLKRVERMGDLFDPVLKLKQRLPRAAARSIGKLSESVQKPTSEVKARPRTKPQGTRASLKRRA